MNQIGSVLEETAIDRDLICRPDKTPHGTYWDHTLRKRNYSESTKCPCIL